jgi:hypothetical protein
MKPKRRPPPLSQSDYYRQYGFHAAYIVKTLIARPKDGVPLQQMIEEEIQHFANGERSFREARKALVAAGLIKERKVGSAKIIQATPALLLREHERLDIARKYLSEKPDKTESEICLLERVEEQRILLLGNKV